MSLDSKKGLFLLGIIAGLSAMVLAIGGNPKNMAMCIACFIRDTSGAFKLHQAEVVQYFRPEIVGIILGAFLVSLFSKEYRSTGGSAPAIRFLLGAIMVICALVFLGCPLRMVLRMSAGDISGYVGLVGFALGVGTGAFFLKKGFSLGRSYTIKKESGYVLPLLITVAFLVSLFAPSLFAFSEKGPGSVHAAIGLSLGAGIIFGIIAQKSRMCFAGSIRDIILLKDFKLISVIGGVFVVMLVYNIASGNFQIAAYGPIAHAQTLWNILSMYAVGLCAVLLGGCPLRQLILAGSGSSDAIVTVVGMFVGAALAHNFSLAGAPASAATADKAAVAGGPGINGQIFVIASIIILLIIAFIGIKKKEQ
jgi:hypothetical protein